MEGGGVVLGVGEVAAFGELPGGHQSRDRIGNGEELMGVSDCLACAVVGLGLVEIVKLVVPAIRDVVFPLIHERLGEVVVGGVGEGVVEVNPNARGDQTVERDGDGRVAVDVVGLAVGEAELIIILFSPAAVGEQTAVVLVMVGVVPVKGGLADEGVSVGDVDRCLEAGVRIGDRQHAVDRDGGRAPGSLDQILGVGVVFLVGEPFFGSGRIGLDVDLVVGADVTQGAGKPTGEDGDLYVGNRNQSRQSSLITTLWTIPPATKEHVCLKETSRIRHQLVS